jgi:hypothetical protein
MDMEDNDRPDILMCIHCKTFFIECEQCWCILNSKYDNHNCPVFVEDEGLGNDPTVFPCEESGILGKKCRLICLGPA